MAVTMDTVAPRWRQALARLMRLAKSTGQAVQFNFQCRDSLQLQQQFKILESRLGCPLPPAYQSLLSMTDGCINLFRGASLMSLDELMSGSAQQKVDEQMQELTTPIPSTLIAADATRSWRDGNMLCIGSNQQADTIFVLDLSSRRPSGEMDVIGWFSGVGIRFPSIATWLEFLGDMLELTDQPCSQVAVDRICDLPSAEENTDVAADFYRHSPAVTPPAQAFALC